MSTSPPAFTLAGMIREFAATLPDAPALTMDGRTRTFAELDARSSRAARALLARGITRGDRVAILDRNAPTFYDIVLGAAKIGAITLGLNFRLAAPEIAAIVEEARPALTIASPELSPLLPEGLDIVTLGEEFEGFLAAQPAEDVDAEVHPEDVALLLYSSGTTGRPKGAMITNANLGWTVRMGAEFYRMDQHTVNLVPSPLFHIGGVGYALTAMGQGGHTVLVREIDPAELLRVIERHRVTHTFMVPAVVRMLIDQPAIGETDLSSLRRIAYGAAPMNDRLLLDAIRTFGCDFMGVYGMTETSGTVIALDPADHDPAGPRAAVLRSVGRALPWLEIRIVDPVTATDAEPGGVGEIWVRSGQNMAGYWNQPQLTAEVLVDGGWLRTGDAAYRDAAGFVFLHDRLKDMIVSGGENVYPAEVENVLTGHPDVLEASVIGVPSARWGETVKAIVVSQPGASTSGAELIGWARERLAHYKCPTSVDFVATLPRNAAGKVQKHLLREQFRLGAVTTP